MHSDESNLRALDHPLEVGDIAAARIELLAQDNTMSIQKKRVCCPFFT
jgi:hypothetical protein